MIPPPTRRVAISIELSFAVPWHHATFKGIIDYGRPRGWCCVIDPYLTGPTGREDLSSYHGVVGRLDAPLIELIAAHGLPAVNLIRDPSGADLPSVLIDVQAGSRLAGEHLVACGYRQFACVNATKSFACQPLLEGLTLAVSAYGFAPPTVGESVGDIERSTQENIESRRTLTAWVSGLKPPVGILVRNITLARYLAQIGLELGLRIPEDMGIVLHDGDHVVATSAPPALSALDYDFHRQGYEAAAKLDQLMRGLPAEPRRQFIPPRRVIMRESTDVSVCEDRLVSDAIRFIAANVRKNVTARQIADHLDVSERTLHRKFDQVRNRTIHAEIRRLRVSHIQRLLIESDLPISTLAVDCGFGSTSHFARYFKQEQGITPSAYRQLHRS